MYIVKAIVILYKQILIRKVLKNEVIWRNHRLCNSPAVTSTGYCVWARVIPSPSHCHWSLRNWNPRVHTCTWSHSIYMQNRLPAGWRINQTWDRNALPNVDQLVILRLAHPIKGFSFPHASALICMTWSLLLVRWAVKKLCPNLCFTEQLDLHHTNRKSETNWILGCFEIFVVSASFLSQLSCFERMLIYKTGLCGPLIAEIIKCRSSCCHSV